VREGRFLLGLALLCFTFPSCAESHGPIKHGEDLWDIARVLYPGREVSTDQAMLALLETNPRAFGIPCNANSPCTWARFYACPPYPR
jgi:hypothetical protein